MTEQLDNTLDYELIGKLANLHSCYRNDVIRVADVIQSTVSSTCKELFDSNLNTLKTAINIAECALNDVKNVIEQYKHHNTDVPDGTVKTCCRCGVSFIGKSHEVLCEGCVQKLNQLKE